MAKLICFSPALFTYYLSQFNSFIIWNRHLPTRTHLSSILQYWQYPLFGNCQRFRCIEPYLQQNLSALLRETCSRLLPKIHPRESIVFSNLPIKVWDSPGLVSLLLEHKGGDIWTLAQLLYNHNTPSLLQPWKYSFNREIQWSWRLTGTVSPPFPWVWYAHVC